MKCFHFSDPLVLHYETISQKKQISSTFTILITSNGNNNVLRNALYSQLYLMRYITETLLYIFPVMPLEAIYIFLKYCRRWMHVLSAGGCIMKGTRTDTVYSTTPMHFEQCLFWGEC